MSAAPSRQACDRGPESQEALQGYELFQGPTTTRFVIRSMMGAVVRIIVTVGGVCIEGSVRNTSGRCVQGRYPQDTQPALAG